MNSMYRFAIYVLLPVLLYPLFGSGQVHKTDSSGANWWNGRVFYEVFVRSFYDSDGDGIGDFKGLTQQLDYLNDGDPATTTDLGIGGIWLMPINPSPSYHGYDVTDYRGIEPDYGTMEDFEEFLAAAHDRGIKVIMDMVVNHSSTQHPWFVDSRNNLNGKRNYYRWQSNAPGYSGPWGQQVWHYASGSYFYGLFWAGMPDLNYNEIEVRDSIFDIAHYWLDDVGVDGFRLDAIKFIYEAGSILEDTPATVQFWKDYKANAVAAAPNSLLVGEAWTYTQNVIPYVANGGLDLCFEFDLAGALLEAVNNGSPQGLYAKMNEVAAGYPDYRWASFLTNHDMDRVFEQLGRNVDKNKLAAAIYLSLPGTPFIYYGEEIGMLGVKPDPDIRRPMQWTPGANAGFTTGNPWKSPNSNYPTYNVATMQADTGSLLHRYKQMVGIRNSKPALQRGLYMGLRSGQAPVYAFLRHLPDDTALVVVNTSAFPVQNVTVDLSSAGLPGGSQQWWEMLGQRYEMVTASPQDSLLLPILGGYGVKIYSMDRVALEAQAPFDLGKGLLVHPNPALDEIEVLLETPGMLHYALEIYDLNGKMVASHQRLPSGSPQRLSISELPPGTYVILVHAGDLQAVKRLVKQ